MLPDDYGAFYEFHEPRALALLKAARDRGVTVQLVVDGKQYGDGNREAAREAGILRLVKTWRTRAKIPHNKFLVRCTAAGTPAEVWTGSTNLSEKGIFGQCNIGHAVKDRGLAGRYLEFWTALEADPARAALVQEVMRLQADVPAADLPGDAITAIFRPRDPTAMLDVYADLVAGAAIKHPIDQWLKEPSAAGLFYDGTDYVHDKLLVVDPLGASPVVGSADFSEPSTHANDENMLVLKGPAFAREADVSLTEFIRLFDHFNFREWLNSDPADFKPFLEEGVQASGGTWVNKYFGNPEYLSYKRKIAFRNMIVQA